MADNPVFNSDNLEMGESRRGEGQREKKINNEGFSTIDISQGAEKEVDAFKSDVKEFDPHLKLRFSILIGAGIISIIWVIIHFSFIQDYNTDKDDM